MYYFKQPPMFDHKLSNISVELLKYSILLQMVFGFIMFNNNQVFTPTGDNKESSLFTDSPGFIISNHAIPFFICAILFILFSLGEFIFVQFF